MNCGTCAYARLNNRSGELECHKNPPQVVVIKWSTMTVWPDVRPSDWCDAWANGDTAVTS